MAIQKKSLISGRTIEKKAATKHENSVGEAKSLTAKALAGRRLFKAESKRFGAVAARKFMKADR